MIRASLLIKNEEKFELQRESSQMDLRSELRKGNYKSFLRKFHGDFKFVRITEIRIREGRL